MAIRPLLVLAALVTTSAMAQPLPIDLIASSGLTIEPSAVSLVPDISPALGFSVAVTPPVLGERLRLWVAASVSPEGRRGLPDRTAAVGLGIEAPLSGGRNGVHLSLGGAYVSYDGPKREGPCLGIDCPTHDYGQSQYRGLAWAGAIGGRVPLAGGVFANGEVGAFVGGTQFVQPKMSVGVGYRLR